MFQFTHAEKEKARVILTLLRAKRYIALLIMLVFALYLTHNKQKCNQITLTIGTTILIVKNNRMNCVPEISIKQINSCKQY